MIILIPILFVISSCSLFSIRQYFNHTCQSHTAPVNILITKDTKTAFVQCLRDVYVIDLVRGQTTQKIQSSLQGNNILQHMLLTSNQTTLLIVFSLSHLQSWHLNKINQYSLFFNITIPHLSIARTLTLCSNPDLMYISGQPTVLLYNITNMKLVHKPKNFSLKSVSFVESTKHNLFYISSYEIIGLFYQMVVFAINIVQKDTFVIKETIPMVGAQKCRLTLSHDQDQLAVVMHQAGDVSVYDNKVKMERGRMTGHHNLSSFMVFSWNDQILMSFSMDQELILWNTSNYLEIERFDVGFGGQGIALSCDSKVIVVSGPQKSAIIDVSDPLLFGSCNPIENAKADKTHYVLIFLVIISIIEMAYFGHTDLQTTTILLTISLFIPLTHLPLITIFTIIYTIFITTCLCLTIITHWHPKPLLQTLLKKLYNCCLLLTLPLLYHNLSPKAQPLDQIYGILCSFLLTGIMFLGIFNKQLCRILEITLRITYYLCVCQLINMKYVEQLFLLHSFYLILLTLVQYKWNKKAFSSKKLVMLYVLQGITELTVLALQSTQSASLALLLLSFLFSTICKILYCHGQQQHSEAQQAVQLSQLRPQQSSTMNVSNVVSELR